MTDPYALMGVSAAFGMVLLVVWGGLKASGFAIVYCAVAVAVALFWIIGVGYPGDGGKGLQTAYGRMERGPAEYQYARPRQAPPERYMRARAW